MPISLARTIAYDALRRVATEDSYASEILRARLNAGVPARDAALATEIVMGALRWERLLDFFVARYAEKSVVAIDLEVLIALRMGIYQLRFLARVPPRAAVSESVELVKRARKSSAASLVNAVLRRAASEARQPAEIFFPPELAPADRLALAHSHPTWLVERWLARFGVDETAALLTANNRAPNRACAVLSPGHREEILQSFADNRIQHEPGRLARDAIIVRGGDVASTNEFREGRVAFQDEASQIIPLLLNVQPGDSVLDLCAAPGGKTIPLAQLAGPSAFVVAADRRENRLRAMRERFKNARLSTVHLVALDGAEPLPFRAKFNRILVDAPCSGTGTLARNPEIRWKLKPDDLADLHQRQTKLLASALECLNSGGRLVYSTCSLEPEENEDVIRQVLDERPQFRSIPAEVPEDALAEKIRSETLAGPAGEFRIFPPAYHTDGFFAAVLRRR